MTTYVRSHPDCLSAQAADNVTEDEGCGTRPAEILSTQLFVKMQAGIVSSLITFTSVAGGLCLCLSVVTFIRRLAQHAGLLG